MKKIWTYSQRNPVLFHFYQLQSGSKKVFLENFHMTKLKCNFAAIWSYLNFCTACCLAISQNTTDLEPERAIWVFDCAIYMYFRMHDLIDEMKILCTIRFLKSRGHDIDKLSEVEIIRLIPGGWFFFQIVTPVEKVQGCTFTKMYMHCDGWYIIFNCF